MFRPAARLLAIAVVVCSASGVAGRQSASLIVHEWGTFTTVAGEDGAAVEWLPLGGPQDLPCFVYPFENNRQIKYWPNNNEPPLNYDDARDALRGTVRMETPVLYFYSPHVTRVDVTVGFPQGLLTEWYPKATVAQPMVSATVPRTWTNSLLRWRGVDVRPGESPRLPIESAPSHYYAARAVDAAPVRVADEDERFLFYRGVGGFQPPITATLTDRGALTLRNAGESPIRGVVLFENRGGRIGYRMVGTLRTATTVSAPVLNADMKALRAALERSLVESGLYEKEAKAMVETWRDSWFEEGARLFYIVPNAFVDAVLPLTISPAPSSVVRAFVGRMEVISPATLAAVGDAIAEGDNATVLAYGRFLEPITERVLTNATPSDRKQIKARVNATYRAFVEKMSARCK